MNTNDADLLATSCTTGWLDWVHGGLWLHSNGLVRARLDVAQTRERGRQVHGIGSPDGPKPAAPPVDISRRKEILAVHRTNKAIEFDDVAAARLHRGRRTDRLSVRMADGASHKLLWLPEEPAFDVLQRELPGILGSRFQID